MSKKVDSMWKAIESLKWDQKKIWYSMSGEEWLALAKSGHIVDATMNAFHYGFIKGMRYQKAQEKKRKVAKA